MDKKRKEILFICAKSKMVLNFRVDLIKKFQDKGYSVSVAALDDNYAEKISDLNVDFYCVNDDNRSINPFKFLSLKRKYYNLINKINPDVVYTFMLKPNVFGARAAKKVGVKKIFSMVEGAGDVFVYNTYKWRIVRFIVERLYKKALKVTNKTFFLNNEDRAEFLRRKLVSESKSEVVHGIGVNIDKFAFKEILNPQTFIMVSRLIPSKGVLEYCKAARIVKSKYPTALFGLLGWEDYLTRADIKEYVDDGSIIYYGETDNVIPYLENAGVFVLPTYREGFPVSVMEAQSVGRAVITCDTNGAKDTVIAGYNGFLVNVSDVEELAEKMEYFILNPEKVIEMGKNARKFAEEKFDQKKINEYLFSVVEG